MWVGIIICSIYYLNRNNINYNRVCLKDDKVELRDEVHKTLDIKSSFQERTGEKQMIIQNSTIII